MLTAELLRRLKVVASRLRLSQLDGWVRKELNGYDTGDDLPSYRGPFDAEVKGDFEGPVGTRITNGLIPPTVFQERYRDGWLFKVAFYQSVAELDVLAKATDNLQNPWGADAVARIDHLLAPGASLYPMYVCVGARKTVPPSQVVGVLEAVRNRVLDLALGLEQVEPSAADTPSQASEELRAEASQVIYNIINGGSVAITSGPVSQTVNVAPPRSEEELFDRLEELGVSAAQIDELRSALVADEKDGAVQGEAGPRVKGWLRKLGTRSAAAAGTIGTGAAGDLVSQLVQGYLGQH